ncbi:uncharacterized protein [Linepithema humile]|uniref:uncharacterized protein n=1 Tax=Linepithema humile TaxID=83485 RepID=UPI00351E9406
MEKRLSDPSRPPCQNVPSHSRRNRRRSSRRNNLPDTVLDTWTSGNDQDTGLISNMEYPPRMLWQSTGVPQNVPNNGQRLFTAMSDPSVCGYSPLPLTYTMQPVSLPAMYRMYQPMPVPNVRAVHNRHRRHCNEHSTNVRPSTNNIVANGYGSLQENGRLESNVHIAYQNGDYASLPPTANKDNGINGDELNSEHRRYSDPGLGPAENLPHSNSEDSDSMESGSSITTISRSNKLVLSLIEQMTELKKYNSQLFKELNETKSNLENIKAKLAQCKHNTPTDYQPGMLSEFIREIREANKNCEEVLVIKVKSMLEDKNNQQTREVEDFKNQLLKLTKEKEESNQRVAKLEEEVMALKLSATNEGREIAAFEEETLALRRELQEARASRTLAENHAAKCVNFAVSSSVTPVTFDTPCITSTPVRTALSDTRSLSPVFSSAISSHSSSASSVLRSRSVEVETLLLVSETADQRPSTGTDSESTLREEPAPSTEDESDRSSETTSAPYSTYMNDNATNTVGIKPGNESRNQNSISTDIDDTFTELFTNWEMCKAHIAEKSKLKSLMTDLKSLKEEIQTNILTDIPEEQPDDELSRKWERMEVYIKSLQKKDETEIDALPSILKEEEDSSDSDVTSKRERSIDHASWQRPGEFRNQRSSFKKPRRKKSSLKRSFSETDKSDKSSLQDTKILADSSSSYAVNCGAVNEEESYYLNDSHTSRAITEVPDVAVVGGGCIMPKDFCSTKPLTSRTQTAPSRATAFTYTTAFI